MTGAAASDASGAEKLSWSLTPSEFPRLALVWADGSYHRHELYARLAGRVGWRLAIVSRPPGTKGWVVLTRRWVVERTFAWIGRCRANSKDYERDNRMSEGSIYASSVKMMLNRLAPGTEQPAYKYPRKAPATI